MLWQVFWDGKRGFYCLRSFKSSLWDQLLRSSFTRLASRQSGMWITSELPVIRTELLNATQLTVVLSEKLRVGS